MQEALVQSSLGLAGDLDDVELIEDVEEAFGIRFADCDLQQCRTVGDLFELVKGSLPEGERIGRGCATAMCFYRLRRAILANFGRELRPATPIRELSSVPVDALYRVVRECGFRPPAPVISIWGCVALLLVPTLPLLSIGIGLTWWIAAATAAPAIIAYAYSPIRLPGGIATFGDLVRVVASRNIRALSNDGARLRTSEMWTALKDVISDHTALSKDAIESDTLLLAATKA